MIRIVVIAFVIYIILKLLRADFRRRFAQYQPGQQPPRQMNAVETVKCPHCGTFVAEGTAHECQA